MDYPTFPESFPCHSFETRRFAIINLWFEFDPRGSLAHTHAMWSNVLENVRTFRSKSSRAIFLRSNQYRYSLQNQFHDWKLGIYKIGYASFVVMCCRCILWVSYVLEEYLRHLQLVLWWARDLWHHYGAPILGKRISDYLSAQPDLLSSRVFQIWILHG